MASKTPRRRDPGRSGPRIPSSLQPRNLPDIVGESEWIEYDITGSSPTLMAEALTIAESRLSGVGITGGDLTKAHISDARFEGCELSGVQLGEARLNRVVFTGCRMSGIQLLQANLRNVTFIECKLDEANLKFLSGDYVVFQSCLLRSGDLYSARLNTVSFFDCDLEDTEFSQASMTGTKLHGSTFDGIKGIQNLLPITIEAGQMLSFASCLFGSIGVTVNDDRGESVSES